MVKELLYFPRRNADIAADMTGIYQPMHFGGARKWNRFSHMDGESRELYRALAREVNRSPTFAEEERRKPLRSAAGSRHRRRDACLTSTTVERSNDGRFAGRDHAAAAPQGIARIETGLRPGLQTGSRICRKIVISQCLAPNRQYGTHPA